MAVSSLCTSVYCYSILAFGRASFASKGNEAAKQLNQWLIERTIAEPSFGVKRNKTSRLGVIQITPQHGHECRCL